MKELDWNSLTTKKYIKLARVKKMTLIGLGKNSNYKKYKFDKCGHEKECTAQHLKGNPVCLICLEERLESDALKAGLNIVGKGDKASIRVYECRKCNYRFENQISNIRTKKNQECINCEEDRFKKEALAIGLELVSKGTQNAYRNYKFIKCGHIEKFQITHVRRDNVKCSKCSEIKYEKEAAEYGLKILGSGQKPTYRKYKFLNCGHIKEMLLVNVRRSGGSCEICFETKIKEDAKKAGLQFIKKTNKRNRYAYKVIKCGHFQDFLLEKVRNKQIRCSICLQIKHEKEAAKYGLKILGPGKKSTLRKYKFDECGHTKEMEPGNVRLGFFNCQICEDTSRTQPSNVYLLKIKAGDMQWLKLGYSKRIESRIKQYQLPTNSKIIKLSVVKFKTGNAAHNIESSIHRKFKKHRLPSKKMKKFHTTGFDECYPMEMKETLLKELTLPTKQKKI